MQPWRFLFSLLPTYQSARMQKCPWNPGRNLHPTADESHYISGLQQHSSPVGLPEQQETPMEISAARALLPSYTLKSLLVYTTFPWVPFSSELQTKLPSNLRKI